MKKKLCGEAPARVPHFLGAAVICDLPLLCLCCRCVVAMSVSGQVPHWFGCLILTTQPTLWLYHFGLAHQSRSLLTLFTVPRPALLFLVQYCGAAACWGGHRLARHLSTHHPNSCTCGAACIAPDRKKKSLRLYASLGTLERNRLLFPIQPVFLPNYSIPVKYFHLLAFVPFVSESIIV